MTAKEVKNYKKQFFNRQLMIDNSDNLYKATKKFINIFLVPFFSLTKKSYRCRFTHIYIF